MVLYCATHGMWFLKEHQKLQRKQYRIIWLRVRVEVFDSSSNVMLFNVVKWGPENWLENRCCKETDLALCFGFGYPNRSRNQNPISSEHVDVSNNRKEQICKKLNIMISH